MIQLPSISSLRIALLLSLSFTAAAYSYPFKSLSPKPNPRHKATAAHILTLLGPEDQSWKISPDEAQQLRSCFKFLVPFHPISDQVKRRSTAAQWNATLTLTHDEDEKVNEVIWRPPKGVLELARLAFDYGGDPDVVYAALDPSPFPVPDIEGCKERKCELTRTPYGRKFINQELNAYFMSLFEIIASRGPRVGLDVSLNRYDFFHGHLFLAKDTGRLGILFHAKEYPAYDKQVFPLNMGYCQIGSNATYDNAMNLRNILWLAPLPSDSSKAWVAPGVLVVLDARPGGIIYRDIIPDYVQIARTIYEDDFGAVAVDVNYLNIGVTTPNYELFVC